jgi:hypothetical protein
MTATYATNLLEAAHAVRDAIDNIESTENVAGLLEAVNEACDRINELNAAGRRITSYLEQMIVLAKKELDGGA